MRSSSWIKKLVVVVTVTAVALQAFPVREANAQFVATPHFAIQNLAAELTTPEKIARYIFRNFIYETDRAQFGRDEHWQSPSELMANRRGDCEDFALFAVKILKANGVSAFLVNVYGKKFAHTVAVFKEDGKYNMIDTDTVKRIEADTLDQLFSKLYPHWNKAALVNYNRTTSTGRIVKTFNRK